MPDVPFTTFAFATSDSGTTGHGRTMPERLAEIKNVRDFGALGVDGNDTAAIQAAVDAAIADGGGTVFFPAGFYRITGGGSIDLNAANDMSISFLGIGSASSIDGFFFDDFLFKRSLVSPSNTAVISFEKLRIQNGSSAVGSGAVQMGSCKQLSFRDCNIGSAAVGVTTEDSPGVSSQNILLQGCKFAGAPAVIIGGSGSMTGCEITGSDTAIVLYGHGFQMAGNRIENCNLAIQLGWDSTDTDQGLSGCSIISQSMEGCVVGADFKGTCTGCFFSQLSAQGHAGSGPNEDTPSTYGIRIRADTIFGCVFDACSPNSSYTVAALSIANASTRANNVFIGCAPVASLGGGVDWEPPTNAYTARFIEGSLSPIWLFSALPSGGNVFEGDEFNISDGTNGLNWGDTATNTGTHTTHYLVRYNGSNWTVVGK